MGNGRLELNGLNIDGTDVKSDNFICSDASGTSNHYSIAISNCNINGLGASGCGSFLYANKSMVADSIVIRNSGFIDNMVEFIVMKDEKDDKGYYNAEKIILDKNSFTKNTGVLLNIYRGGNDESTMGPQLFVTGNKFTSCATKNKAAFVQLTGVQKTRFINNTFSNCVTGGTLFSYKDIVRADHLLQKNDIESSGSIQSNAFVTARENSIK
jgi:poly(beta-D-mannuronate) lyase